MAQKLQVKRSATPSAAPTTGQLDLGEIAINTYDGKMFIKKDNGTPSIVEIGAGGGGASALDDLTDVTITSPSTDQILKYNGSAWVNGAASGGGGSVYFKDPVRVATTANITLSGTQTIDGVSVVAGDRVLVKNQSTSANNGIYIVASGAWTRATDADENSELQRGVQVYVQYGTVNGGNTWQLMASDGNPIVVVGTNSQVWIPAHGMIIRGLNGFTAPTSTGTNGIAFGNSANASSSNYGIAIGDTSACGSLQAAIAIGYNSSATGNSAISIGSSAVTGNGTGAICVGTGATTNASNSSVALGRSATVSLSNDNSCAIGYLSKTDMKGEIAFGTGYFAEQGDIKSSIILAWTTTTNTTATELGVGAATTSPTNRIILTADSSYIFDCDIIARNTGTDTESKAWNVKFAIRRGAAAANTSLIGSVTKTVIGSDADLTAWDITVTADTTNGRPKIEVTGEASKTIRWVANIRMTKVAG